MGDAYDQILSSPQLALSDVLSGVHKGVVVDCRDPLKLGRSRVHIYGIHSDYKNLKIDAMPWCWPSQPVRGAFSPPEWGDRVLVSFDAGGMYQPAIIGYWQAIPDGRGTLSFDMVKGTDVRPEGWAHHDLYPESLILAASGEGNVVWFENKQLSESDLLSTIQQEDTGGKYFRIWSYHPGTLDYAATEKIDSDESLNGLSMDPPTVTRTGLEPVITPVAGSIEFGHQNLKRSMLTDDQKFSVDRMIQYSEDESSFDVEQQAIGGAFLKQRQGQASQSMFKESLFLTGKYTFINRPMMTPRRWD